MVRGLKNLVIGLLCSFLASVASAEHADSAVVLEIKGAIGPATADYFARGMAEAQAKSARLIIVTLDTPGGLDESMREIVKQILLSPIPVVAYVSPEGARAASAGTFILYASHVAAMAPATNLGAATPVAWGTVNSNTKINTSDALLQQKIIHDTATYLQSIAELRGRNAQWPLDAVTQGDSITVQTALTNHVIDYEAKDIPNLLQQMNGRIIESSNGKQVLDTQKMQIEVYSPDEREKFLQIITDPTFTYFLFILAFMALFVELSHPGYVAPGLIGIIALILGFYAIHLFTVSYAGLALLAVGFIFMSAELFFPAHGLLGLSGIIAFVIGTVLFMSGHNPLFAPNWWWISAIAVIMLVFMFGLMRMSIRSRFRPPVTGQEALVGAIGIAKESFDHLGEVLIFSETWRARTHVLIHQGQEVKVVKVEGLTIWVEPIEQMDA